MKFKGKEAIFYGVRACLEIWKRRPSDIIKVYLTKTNLPTFSLLLKWCATKKKTYHIVQDEDLYKITDSTHHEGVCFLALEKPYLPFDKIPKDEKCLIFLDGVSNPHNIGSIIRTCTHFGINNILGEKNKMATLSPSACRVAKGGTEHVDISYLENIKKLEVLKKRGFVFIATDSNSLKARSLYEYTFPSQFLLLLGAEDKGLSRHLIKQADIILQIPGTHKIESLNVSVATALFLGEYWRQANKAGAFESGDLL